MAAALYCLLYGSSPVFGRSPDRTGLNRLQSPL